MTAELRYEYGASLIIDGAPYPYPRAQVTITVDGDHAGGVVSVGTTAAALPQAQVANPKAAIFTNLDAVNFVDILAGDGGDIIARIPAGASIPVLLDGATAVWAQANTAAVDLFYQIFQASA